MPTWRPKSIFKNENIFLKNLIIALHEWFLITFFDILAKYSQIYIHESIKSTIRALPLLQGEGVNDQQHDFQPKLPTQTPISVPISVLKESGWGRILSRTSMLATVGKTTINSINIHLRVGQWTH